MSRLLGYIIAQGSFRVMKSFSKIFDDGSICFSFLRAVLLCSSLTARASARLLASARVPGKIDDNSLLWQNYEGIYSSGRDREKEYLQDWRHNHGTR
jgi:hypothetical protein